MPTSTPLIQAQSDPPLTKYSILFIYAPYHLTPQLANLPSHEVDITILEVAEFISRYPSECLFEIKRLTL